MGFLGIGGITHKLKDAGKWRAVLWGLAVAVGLLGLGILFRGCGC